MNTKLSGLTLGFAIATLAVSPAMAGGDVIYQGIKDPHAAAVPVPAPIPVELYDPEYYVRLDVGGAFIGSGVDEVGTPNDIRSPGSIEAIESGGIGFGRYITPSIRAEFTVDLYTKADLGESSANTYIDSLQGVGIDDAAGNPTTDTRTYDVTRLEQIKYEQDLGLVSLYYDIKNHSRFTPYVGAGLGVTYRQLTRTATEQANCRDTHNSDTTPGGVEEGYHPPAPAAYAPYCGNTQSSLPITQTLSSEEEIKRWDIAAAAMAGFSVEVSDNILWDTGYRVVWQNNTLSSSSPSISGNSKVELDDTIQHQIRTGIRLNIN
jgi:opacity protein-like surface antigen